MASESLFRKRGTVKGCITRYTNLVEKNNSNLTYLKELINNVRPLRNEFYTIQAQIDECLRDIDTDAYDQFEESYFNLLADINSKIDSLTISNKPATNVSNNSSHNNVNLPKITIPSFDGSFERWTAFRDLFISLIHSNETISNIEKFHYLKTALSGEALRVIENVPLAATNYEIAWNCIVSRYNNKKYITKKHIRALLKLAPINKINIRESLDTINTNYRALEAIGEPVNKWDSLLIEIISDKFDQKLNEEWETFTNDDDKQLYTHMVEFMTKKHQILEAIGEHKSFKFEKPKPTFKKSLVTSISKKPTTVSCALCNQSHYLYQCKSFADMPTKSRFEFVKSKELCLNCFHFAHKVGDCKSKACRTCNKKHHSLLHFSTEDTKKQTETVNETVTSTVNLHTQLKSEILLSTAIVSIEDNSGNKQTCRVLLDCGSQSNYITEECAKRLNLRKSKVNIPVLGLGGSQSNIFATVNAKLTSQCTSHSFNSSLLVIKNITSNLPSSTFNVNFKLPRHVILADPDFNISRPVDILIGAELFYSLLCPDQITLKNTPILQKTKFGWIVSGPIMYNNTNNKTFCNLSTLETLVHNFWKIEGHDEKSGLTAEQVFCEEHFCKTVARNKNGRFIVTLPTNNELSNLGCSRKPAFKRFHALEAKLNSNPDLREQYTSFMNEYKTLNHMQLVTNAQTDDTQYFLPHHAILKDDSLTTKLRVVFDGSARTDTGLSLNNVLSIGPPVQDELFAILIRFRTYKYAITADITKMYRQILINPEQRKLQSILWRDNPNKPIETYELSTVTYGTSCAPYLATKCLNYLADLEKSNFPIGSRVLRHDFYVDDLLSGANTREEVLIIKQQLIELLKKGAFQLRKWASNDSSLLSDLKANNADHLIIEFNTTDNLKTLGIQWNVIRDKLEYRSKSFDSNRITKRNALSTIASVFDPLGLISPVVVKGKLFIQKLWKADITWDDEIPTHLQLEWSEFCKDLSTLNEISVARNILINSFNSSQLELHGFSDASKQAYGASIYILSRSNSGTSCQLLCSKSRIAPIKVLTIPRLELCAALLLAQLTNKVLKCIKLEFKNVCYYTDSTIVLSWIKSDSAKYKVFIANRISEIQDVSKGSQWFHVSTKSNPADIVSRGSSTDLLKNNSLWWHGPSWLLLDPTQWPTNKTKVEIETCTDEIITTLVTTKTVDTFNIFERFSSYIKLIRVMSYCRRFLTKNVSGLLTPVEMERTEHCLIRLIQSTHFKTELKQLNANNQVNKQGPLAKLNPFLENNLIRVGGRIKYSNLAYSTKHPIVLPKGHIFSKLLIEYIHNENFHVGINQTLAIIREKYWIVDARNQIQHVIHKCIRCFKAKPQIVTYPMGDLPVHRVNFARPFKHCGVDYAGPIFIKEGTVRSRRKLKSYIAVFICLASKAIHLELVTSLTTDAFLAALKRCMARRGKISDIWSDNGTNFVGAANELKELYDFFKNDQTKNLLINNASSNNINWHFIPANSPHFGGIWEAGVKSVKTLLKRTLGQSLLTYEEFYSCLVQIEAILNSRPLTPLSSDPNDFIPLTPAHLLIGESLLSTNEADLTNENPSRLSRWQHIEQLKQHFWNRWQREYITNLQQRTKWFSSQDKNIQIGDLVLIKEDHLPPLCWMLGRVETVHPGQDNIIRAVTVKTNKGQLKRTVRKLCKLPIEE